MTDLLENGSENSNRRVDEHYPESVHNTADGAHSERIHQAATNRHDPSSDYDVPRPPSSQSQVGLSGELSPGINKQAIGAEAPPTSLESVFQGVCPMIVLNDNESSDAHAPDTMAHEVGHKISGLQVTMSNAFIDQFVSEYMSRIFLGALKYTCGGPDFFDLFFEFGSRC